MPKINEFFPSESEHINSICLKICSEILEIPIFYSYKETIFFEDSSLILLKIQQLVVGILKISEEKEGSLKLIDYIKKIIEFVSRVDMEKVKFLA